MVWLASRQAARQVVRTAAWMLLLAPVLAAAQPTARELVERAVDNTRGQTSYAVMSMTIRRPAWERTSTLEAWTRGREDALIRFTAPARDAGNATLKQGEKMWTFTPKLNRTIRLPFSLMSQSWAGSDFSYNDLSRTDNVLRQYDLSIAATEEQDGHTLYTIVAVPHDDAPVVWGKEEWVMREDGVLYAQRFFDQDLNVFKEMITQEVGERGGRVMPVRMRMYEVEQPDHYTEVSYDEASFDLELEDRLFTLFSLRQGGR